MLLTGAAVWHFAFKSIPAPVGKAEPPKTASPVSDKPSIAVLPFINMSGDPQQEYFGDGIAEDIITDLSKIAGLIVIAGSTSSTYKGRAANVQQVGRDLGVHYLLDGSVRKAGDQMRINAQLIDTSSGQHLWADRYDGKMDDVFALQDHITHKIISALALKLTANEKKAVADRGTNNIQAYDEFLKGWQNYRLLSKEGFAEAKVHLEKAVELDPEFCRAYAALAVLYWRASQFAGLQQGLGLTDFNSVSVATLKSHHLLKKAMKKPTALAYGLSSQIYLYRFLHDKALAAIERAIAMDPNDPDLYAWLSNILWFMGENSEAIEAAKKAQRLDPNNPALYLFHLGSAYRRTVTSNKAFISWNGRECSIRNLASAALRQTIVYALQGRDDEARDTLQAFLPLRPTGTPLSLKILMAGFPFADRNTSDRIATALVKAGVPDHRTDYCRLSRNNLLNGNEITSLLAGRSITGISASTGEQFWCEWGKNGEFRFTRGAYRDSGKYWIEEDILFAQFDKLYDGLPFGSTIFRNARGTKVDKNEYFILLDLGAIVPFTLVE